jgi:Flp pilus assembly protein TadD
MRALKTPLVAIFVVLFLTSWTPSEAGAQRSISGRLTFENPSFVCEQQCIVTVMAFGGRPLESVLADLSGRFAFSNFPRGPFSIRVDIEGYEPVTQSFREYDGFGLDVNVRLVRRQSEPEGPAEVVNISEFVERYPKKAVSLFEKGKDSLKNKKNGDAVKYLRQAVELAPTFAEAHNQLGVAYRSEGRFQEAEREFWIAHELNSTGVQPLLNLTSLYLDENKPEDAVGAGEQAVKANSRSASAFLSLGVALYKASHLSRAEAALKRALDLAPKMATVRLMLANVYLKLRRYDATLQQLDSYIVENPKGDQLVEALRMRDQLLQAAAVKRP